MTTLSKLYTPKKSIPPGEAKAQFLFMDNG